MVIAWAGGGAVGRPAQGTSSGFTLGTSWLAVQSSESTAAAPGSSGAVGPSQVLVVTNGRFKLFDKTGNLQGLDTTDIAFFSSVSGCADACLSNPHVRYDRLSGRWFIAELTTTGAPNKVLLAVSSGSTITDASSFSFFQFAIDPAVTDPYTAVDPTLAVDPYAVYVGVRMIDSNGVSSDARGARGFVVNKASLIAGTLAVTSLDIPAVSASVRGLQGVDSDVTDWAQGYFVAVHGATSLHVTIINDPGGTPSIGYNYYFDRVAGIAPVDQTAMGTVGKLEGLDLRFSAKIKKTLSGTKSLWIAQTSSTHTPQRNAVNWYEIWLSSLIFFHGNYQQFGRVVDLSATDPRGYWMPSIAVNGQGHMAIGANVASANDGAGIYITGRLASDPPSYTAPGDLVAGVPSYNAEPAATIKQWGPYSETVVDPTDDQTMWTFQEYCNATDSWGVRVIKIMAPPPAAIASVSPISVDVSTSAAVTVLGLSTAGSGFFDSGAGFAGRLTATVSGMAVNSVTFVNGTTLRLDLSTVGASSGTRNVVITNPDGQQVVGTVAFTLNAPAVVSVSPNRASTVGGTTVTITGTSFVAGSTTVTIGGAAATGVSVGSPTSLTAVIPAHGAGAADVSATTANGTGSLAGKFSYFQSMFTDDPLQGGQTALKAVHIAELRSYVDTLRVRYGLSGFAWTDSDLIAGVTLVRAVHVTELRTALSAAYVASRRMPPTYSDTITVGTTVVTAAQLAEIRAAVLAIY